MYSNTTCGSGLKKNSAYKTAYKTTTRTLLDLLKTSFVREQTGSVY